MDKQQGFGGGLFGAYGPSDPTMNVPVTSSPNSVMSPYLNFNPAYVTPGAEPEFIFPEGASARRGRFELAFAQIGASVFVGATAGGLNGAYTGLNETRVAQLTGTVRRTQMLNFIAKQGASSAQTLGVIALMYSIFGIVVSKSRGAEDELNTLAAGTLTGLLFKSSAGNWKKCARAGGIGFSLAAIYCMYTSKDRVKQIFGMDR